MQVEAAYREANNCFAYVDDYGSHFVGCICINSQDVPEIPELSQLEHTKWEFTERTLSRFPEGHTGYYFVVPADGIHHIDFVIRYYSLLYGV